MKAQPRCGVAEKTVPTLIESELGVVDRHLKRIKMMTAALTALLADERWHRGAPTGGHRYPPPGFKQPRMATTLAVLGPRGSGKSTCVVDLFEKLASEAAGAKGKVPGNKTPCLSGYMIVQQPVDCTLGPRDVPLGLSVLMRLRRLLGLENEQTAGWSYREQGRIYPAAEDEERAFRAMREAYMLSRPEAERVLETTSSSGAHFALQASSAAANTLELPDRVADWLQKAVCCLPEEVDGFILGLDDVDLAQNGVEGLINSLLDELHQPRLILVIAADLPRLERRLAGTSDERQSAATSANRRLAETPADEIGLESARDLVYKALPQRNREHLRPWNEEERWAFAPLLPSPTSPQERCLKDMLQKCKGWGVPIRNPGLLPSFPRGLENLWFALRGFEDEQPSAGSSNGMLENLEVYLEYLAEARREAALGRQVSKREAASWARQLIWQEDRIGSAQWERLVMAALEGSPLLGFQATSDALPLPVDDPSSAALWTELLVDLSLSPKNDEKRGELSSTELVSRFPGMKEIVDQSRIRADFHRDEMEAQLRRPRGSVVAQLAWTRFDVTLDRRGDIPEEFDAFIGIAPLHEAAEGRRNVWPARLAQGLFLQRSDVLGPGEDTHILDGASGSIQGILPEAVRPLIVFVDSLRRAPWTRLSEMNRRRGLRINVLLAAGLVHAAYVDALSRVFDALGGRKKPKTAARYTPSDSQSAWMDALYDRASRPIVEWSDEMVEEQFHALPKSPVVVNRTSKTSGLRKLTAKDLQDKRKPQLDWEFVFAPYNELVRCLDAYTSSRFYLDLADPDFNRPST